MPRFLRGEASFLAMVGFFLLAQIVYVVVLWAVRRRSVLSRSLLVLPYLGVWFLVISACAAGAGPLLVPVGVYGAALVAMAALSTGLGRWGGVGGAIFLVSDVLIALHAFAGLTLPGHDVWVMSTYVLGQTLLVLAVRRCGALPIPGGPV